MLLFMITKIQKLSAIHNTDASQLLASPVVYDYKDTEIVSNSQQIIEHLGKEMGCL